ncbi:uncharacterized protein MELLADRAFT_64641 [Melampsora larici-populina 98AG31]|uniref:OTU domain-containing protein n=1 Tax=Melampsora larici-populina (strain 98AG31 / pathotype 3-4-7) TaxID=747676 RepID=F4RS81_MELLP|nr:uncharacterized protein MELLADRAFT_64641 [Melampsora larici-populina 98AG31]EGG04825.1 hypothetical protein MELLADRAFT_64641 [Melampsora larici-populina 98AG31]
MDQNKYIMPVPDLIQIHHKDRRKMDDYVLDFPATEHGYRIRIGNSQKKSSSVSHYECYRSGYPSGRANFAGTTKSARIGCPFKLDTRYLHDFSTWILIHTHLGHNHPTDPNVKPRKRYKDPKAGPILAPGVLLDDEVIVNDKASPILHEPAIGTSHLNSKLDPTSTAEGPNSLANTNYSWKIEPTLTKPTTTTHPLPIRNIDQHPGQPNYDIERDPQLNNSLDTTLSNLRAHLSAMTPDRQQDILKKIQTLISNERIINNEGKLPILFLPEPTQQTLLQELENNTPILPYASLDIGVDQEERSVESLIEQFCGPSEITTSTFNFEDLLISQPTPERPQPVHTLTQHSLSPTGPLDSGIEESPSQPIDSSLQLPKSDCLAQLPYQPVASDPVASEPVPSEPVAFDCLPGIPICTSPTSSSQTSPPTTLSPRVTTRKRCREAALIQRPNVINPNLPALMAKYHLHSWLEPFVIDIREVKADGHCGFRAIAISIGQSQDEWERIREKMADTVKNIEDERPLPENRSDALARLLTSKPNVASDRKHWLGMPSWGGVIATTFNRPVLYYDPGSYSQLVFPYFSPYNMNPPIVLAYADLHFTSLLLDFTKPNFPAPRLCGTWRRFHKPEASTWLEPWQPLIDGHAEHMKGLNKHRKKKKNPVCIVD